MPAHTLLVLPATVLSDTNSVGDYNSMDRGSDRGSGHNWCNTILRHCDKLFATWQSYNPTTKKYTVWVGTNQLGTGLWRTPVALGDPALLREWTAQAEYKQMDNHGVASIIADSDGFLHLLYGPHHAPMLEAISKKPWDASDFRPPQIIDTKPWPLTTYSSIVRDNVGAFHLLYRGKDRMAPQDHWRMIYQRGTTNGTGVTTWGDPLVLASTANGATNATGYSIYCGAIAVSGRKKQSSLHVAYQMYHDYPRAASSWGYLRSDDGGDHWRDWKDDDVTSILPIDTTRIKIAHLVQSSPTMDVRVCNIAVDQHGNPWISVLYLALPPGQMMSGYDTRLWHRSSGQCSSISLSLYVSSFGPSWRIAGATITFDAQGILYVAAERVDMSDTSTPFPWQYGKSKEVIVLMSADMGQTFQVYPISQPNLVRPRWLANIERPTTTAAIPIPSLQYTDGPLTPDVSDLSTDIVFVPLYKY